MMPSYRNTIKKRLINENMSFFPFTDSFKISKGKNIILG